MNEADEEERRRAAEYRAFLERPRDYDCISVSLDRVLEVIADAEARGAQAEREAAVVMLRGLLAERRLSYAALGTLSGILEAIEAGKHRDVARAQAARKPAGGG